MKPSNTGILIVAIVVVIGFAACVIIIGIQKDTINTKNEIIAAKDVTIKLIEAQAEIDLKEAWEAAENEKQKAEQDLYEMSVDDVLNLFMPEGIPAASNAYYDGIFAEQIRTFESVLQSLGLCIAKVKPKD